MVFYHRIGQIDEFAILSVCCLMTFNLHWKCNFRKYSSSFSFVFLEMNDGIINTNNIMLLSTVSLSLSFFSSIISIIAIRSYVFHPFIY